MAAWYKPRITDEPLEIEHQVEGRVEAHCDDVHLKQSVLEERFNRRSFGRTNDWNQ